MRWRPQSISCSLRSASTGEAAIWFAQCDSAQPRCSCVLTIHLGLRPSFACRALSATATSSRCHSAFLSARYNALFRFLLEVRRVQLELQRTWTPQSQLTSASSPSPRLGASVGGGSARGPLQPRQPLFQRGQPPPHVRLLPVLALRARMQFLVDQLQFYLHVDVLESNYAALAARIRGSISSGTGSASAGDSAAATKAEPAADFEWLRRWHEEFLTACSAGCFLRDRGLHAALSDVLGACIGIDVTIRLVAVF